jgi:hypothetical protein
MKLLFAENPISVKLSYPIIINVYSDSYTTHRVFNLSRWNVFLDFGYHDGEITFDTGEYFHETDT